MAKNVQARTGAFLLAIERISGLPEAVSWVLKMPRGSTGRRSAKNAGFFVPSLRRDNWAVELRNLTALFE
jgi:hypothetical protein